MEIAFRMHQHKLPILNAHTAFVYTTVPTTLRTLIKQRTRWTQGFLQNTRDYRHMVGNRRYGNFGLLALPFGLVMFFGALYTAFYLAYRVAQTIAERALDFYATGVPLTPPQLPALDWFYLQTGMLMFLTVAVFGMTLTAIVIGRRIGQTRIGWYSLISYFALYGFIAPLWLARAAWGAALARETRWR
jgi:cellulose synthase/poly-beta-1,6-N-acetylglucosamine synthase-like glycosyltransferase